MVGHRSETAITTLNKVYLRVEPATNNQSKRIRWAADYELARFEP